MLPNRGPSVARDRPQTQSHVTDEGDAGSSVQDSMGQALDSGGGEGHALVGTLTQVGREQPLGRQLLPEPLRQVPGFATLLRQGLMRPADRFETVAGCFKYRIPHPVSLSSSQQTRSNPPPGSGSAALVRGFSVRNGPQSRRSVPSSGAN